MEYTMRFLKTYALPYFSKARITDLNEAEVTKNSLFGARSTADERRRRTQASFTTGVVVQSAPYA